MDAVAKLAEIEKALDKLHTNLTRIEASKVHYGSSDEDLDPERVVAFSQAIAGIKRIIHSK
jgi:hypothetical protein